MSPTAEISLIAAREVRKNIRSVKGIILGVLSLLGGTLAALVMAWLEQVRKSELLQKMSEDQVHDWQVQGLQATYHDLDMGRSLAEAPIVLLVLLNMTVWLTPMLVALMGFDSVSGDLQHKSVRYFTLRSRRWSYFVGKWAGLWATVSVVTLAMDAFVWVVCIARGQATLAATLGWGIRFWLTSLPIGAVWCGIAVLISSLTRSPILSLLVTFVTFFVLWLLNLVGIVSIVRESGTFDWLVYAYPNHYDALLLHPFANKVAAGIGACLGMAALYIGAGSYVFTKRDV